MSDPWEEDGKAMEMSIPGMALPGLRDLRVQFVALIEFDLFMGPVVYLKEISKGSSYIAKLQDYQTVSEVYAGVARADVDVLSTLEDTIAVFRRENDDDAEVSTVLLLSCSPGSDMEPIKIIGSKALNRSRGDPEKISEELSIALREYQTGSQFFERADGKQKIKILDTNQIQKALDLAFIKGCSMIDLDAKIADFRYFPPYLDGRDLDPAKILTYMDLQFNEILGDYITSLMFNGLSLVVMRVKKKDVFMLILVDHPDLTQIEQLGEWLKHTIQIIDQEWRFSSDSEILTTLSILNQAFKLKSPPQFIKNYIQTSMTADKLKPLRTSEDISDMDQPNYITEAMWEAVEDLDGTNSIYTIATNRNLSKFDLIKFLEWGKYRHIFQYLTK